MSLAKTFSKISSFIAMAVLSFSAVAADGAHVYDKNAFNKAQAENKMIVVDIYKDGCGTCAKQKPTLDEARVKYPDATFFRVDFANDKEAVKRFKAVKQSTIIVYKGEQEKGRVLGETDRDKLLNMISLGAS